MGSALYEYHKKYINAYKEKNKDKIKEYFKEKIECEVCKSSVIKYSYKRHTTSNKHKKNLELQNKVIN